ncbi:hypothetical protein PoB_004943000 [Plakobranchus ocellatus]|uniref:Uncharacterized protein n=1 Tax=Plakobranchus ocellatus TaxID=259542 RepID=A0AAV4BUD9_9GAST|nr:hypothetical protein PoB_004943000 [Plakobranchus ocellatus]
MYVCVFVNGPSVRIPENAVWDDELMNNSGTCPEDAGLRKRSIGPYLNLDGPHENSEKASHAALAGELYKVCAWGTENRLPWSSAWIGSNRPSGRERGERGLFIL